MRGFGGFANVMQWVITAACLKWVLGASSTVVQKVDMRKTVQVQLLTAGKSLDNMRGRLDNLFLSHVQLLLHIPLPGVLHMW